MSPVYQSLGSALESNPGSEVREMSDLSVDGLSQRRALITGASAGLGYAAARALGEQGCHLTLVARGIRGLESARAELLSELPQAQVEILPTDLMDSEAVHRLASDQALIGCPDILVYVAGGPPLYEPGTETESDFRRFLESHSISFWCLVRTFAPLMQKRGWGRVISVMSRAVAEPRVDNLLSAAVRLPALGVLKSYSRSSSFPDVTFNAVLPGLFDTKRFAEVCETISVRGGERIEAIRASYLSEVPAGRLGRPRELGALCAYLASDVGGYINGQRLVIDGGSSNSF